MLPEFTLRMPEPWRRDKLIVKCVPDGGPVSRGDRRTASGKDFRKPGRDFNPAFLHALRDWATKVWIEKR